MMLRTILILVPLAILAGCHGGDEPTPPRDLPLLERPTAPVTEQGGRLLAPASAVVERSGMDHVFILQGGEARARLVEVGKTRGNRVEILAGLREGETLVVGELGDVRDGSPVTPR